MIHACDTTSYDAIFHLTVAILSFRNRKDFNISFCVWPNLCDPIRLLRTLVICKYEIRQLRRQVVCIYAYRSLLLFVLIWNSNFRNAKLCELNLKIFTWWDFGGDLYGKFPICEGVQNIIYSQRVSTSQVGKLEFYIWKCNL